MTKSRNVVSALLITVMIASVFCLPALTNNKVDAAAKKVKITFKANGGMFTAKKYAKKASYAKKINKTKKGKKLGKLPTVKRDGYDFKGWYTNKAKGKKVTKNTKIKKTTTLYARWKKQSNPASPPIVKPQTFTVTFDPQNYTETSEKTVTYNMKYGNIFPTPTFPGYTFKGWVTASGTPVNSNTVHETAGNITLYAKWEMGYYGINKAYLDALGKTPQQLQREIPFLSPMPDWLGGEDEYLDYNGKKYTLYSYNEESDYLFEDNICVAVCASVSKTFPNVTEDITLSEFDKVYGSGTPFPVDNPDDMIYKLNSINLELDIGEGSIKPSAAIFTIPYNDFNTIFLL